MWPLEGLLPEQLAGPVTGVLPKHLARPMTGRLARVNRSIPASARAGRRWRAR